MLPAVCVIYLCGELRTSCTHLKVRCFGCYARLRERRYETSQRCRARSCCSVAGYLARFLQFAQRPQIGTGIFAVAINGELDFTVAETL